MKRPRVRAWVSVEKAAELLEVKRDEILDLVRKERIVAISVQGKLQIHLSSLGRLAAEEGK